MRLGGRVLESVACGRASESELWRKGAGKRGLEKGCRSEARMKGAGK